MIFGSISYLNLLPFQMFVKQKLRNTQALQILRWHRAAPSSINRLFHSRKVHAAFISSITSRNCHCTDLGIAADGDVLSVLLIPGQLKKDRESASSNILAQILGLEGQVIIGDKALRHYLDGGRGIDLAEKWKEQTGLPFVFARLCYNRHGRRVRRLADDFAKSEWKIPRYFLISAAEKKGITPEELKKYLEKISYTIGWREKKALRLFLKKSRKLHPRHKVKV